MTSIGVTSHDALSLHTRLDAGSGPGLLLAHANGFCLDVWDPVVEELRRRGVPNPVARWDQRAHGSSDSPGEMDWWDAGRDALAVLDHLGWDRVAAGVGHSFGGATIVLAELLRPGTFCSMILIEPIVFPGPYERFPDQPLAVMARKRRPEFEDRDTAYANFATKPTFSNWDPRALAGYIDGGFAERDGRWALRCEPSVEAETFEVATMHGAWERLDEVMCPVLIVAGEDSDSHPEHFVLNQASRFDLATHRIVDGSGHFVPMEKPDVVADLIADFAGL